MTSFVLLLENETEASWTVINEKIERVESIQHHQLTEIGGSLHDHPVILIIDSHYVNQFITQIPSKDGKKLQKAIPFALEGRIANKLDDIHFTYISSKENEQIVTVIAKSDLEKILSKLEKENIFPTKIYSSNMLLPYKESYWTVMIRNKEILLNLNQYQSYGFEAMHFEVMLEKLLKKEGAPKFFRIFLMYPYDMEPLLTLLKKYHIQYYIDDRTHYPALNLLIAGLKERDPKWHLLESSFDAKRKLRTSLNALYLAAAALIFALIFTAIRTSLIYHDLNQQKALSSKAIGGVAKMLYPKQILTNQALKRLIIADLNQLKYHQNEPLLNALKILSNVFQEHQQKMKVLKIHYINKQLDLDFSHNSPKELETFINTLTEKHYQIKLLRSKLSDRGISSKIRITL